MKEFADNRGLPTWEICPAMTRSESRPSGWDIIALTAGAQQPINENKSATIHLATKTHLLNDRLLLSAIESTDFVFPLSTFCFPCTSYMAVTSNKSCFSENKTPSVFLKICFYKMLANLHCHFHIRCIEQAKNDSSGSFSLQSPTVPTYFRAVKLNEAQT